RFHAAHHQTYGYSYADHPEQRIEWVNVRVAGIGPLRRPEIRPRPRHSAGGAERARAGERPVYFETRMLATPVYARAGLHSGDCLDGPAIVEEFGSTTVVVPSQTARVDDFGNLVLERKP